MEEEPMMEAVETKAPVRESPKAAVRGRKCAEAGRGADGSEWARGKSAWSK
jgi:hypothetical protein